MIHVFVMGLAALFAAGPDPRLTLDDCAARARPGAAEARLAAELAQLESEIAAERGLLREGPELSALLGRRSAAGETDGDFGLEIDLPLASRSSRRAHADLAATLEAKKRLLLEAARLEDRRELTAAFLALWNAQQRRQLLESNALELEAFSRLIAERIAAGAAAAYEGVWAGKEARLARGEAALAAAAEKEAWAELLRFTALPADPLPRLERPIFALPQAGAAVKEEAVQKEALQREALRAAARLARERGAWSRERELSRWGLAASLAREGEESLASLGWRWRLPLPGERGALRARGEAEKREAELAEERKLEAQAARIARSLDLLAALGEPRSEDADDELLWRAVEARVREGKDTPAAALALSRAVSAARLAELEIEERRLAAQAELYFLTQEISP